MNTFDTFIHGRLLEASDTFSRDDLDANVFLFRDDGMPVLRDSIRIQILKDIDEIRSVLPVVNFFMIGDILTRNFEHNTCIDVSVEIDPQLIDSIATADVMHLLKYLNGKLASDTQHPINYYLISYELDETKVEALYDLVNDTWTKSPRRFNPTVEAIASKFQSALTSIDIATGKLLRDIVDLDDIRSLDDKDIKRLRYVLRQKKMQVDELIKYITGTQQKKANFKHISFDVFNTPEDVLYFIKVHQIPENVTQKLFEKYYYTKFIKKIESIMDDRGILGLSENPNIERLMGEPWKSA